VWTSAALVSVGQRFLTFSFLRFPRLNSIAMSYPSTEVICGKCGAIISKIINLRPIRDVLRTHGWRCETCGNALNPSDFTIDIERL
jgi:DNA-directed RNA polymerase subunit RPC12/RpoP